MQPNRYELIVIIDYRIYPEVIGGRLVILWVLRLLISISMQTLQLSVVLPLYNVCWFS